MIIVFSGFNQRAVVAMLRALEKNHIEDVRILACGDDDPVLRSLYVKNVCLIRKHRELYKPELYGAMKMIADEAAGDVTLVVPSSEGLNRFLLNNREEIESLGVTVPLADKDIYEKISDKHTFWDLCRAEGFKVPQIVKISDTYKFMYAAKPVSYVSSSGKRLIPVIVDNEDKHKEFLPNYSASDFDIQEYVDGESIYLLYYLSRHGKTLSFSQRNLVQQPGGKSIIAAISWDTHREKISDDYMRMFRSLGFYGFIMVELRRKGSNYYMIEANPRMWGPSQLYVDAGIPFIEAFLSDYGIMNRMPENYSEKLTAYFWSGGIREALLEDKNCVWHKGGREIAEKYLDLIYSSDIYKRTDTADIYLAEREAWKNML